MTSSLRCTPHQKALLQVTHHHKLPPSSFMALVASPPNHRSHAFSALIPTTPTNPGGSDSGTLILPRIKLSVSRTSFLQSSSSCVNKCRSSEDSQALLQRADNAQNADSGSAEEKMSVRRRKKWNSLDVGTAGVVWTMHFLSVFAPWAFNWSPFWLAMALYVVTGLLGITLSFNRNLSTGVSSFPNG